MPMFFPFKSSSISKIPEKPQTDARGIDPLFREIVEIIGTDNLRPRESPIGVSVSQETRVRAAGLREELPPGTGRVRQFADESIGLDYEKTLIPKDTQLATPDVNDVSPIVHKVTEIVRAENNEILMEERSENLGIQFDSKVVEKVLKRCFKVRNLAFRFFKGVQLRAGFRDTTGTYNTMIYIAGEAKEFDLVEKLVEEMEKQVVSEGYKDMDHSHISLWEGKTYWKSLAGLRKNEEI
uniref:Uncharacterized protein n=1 Tax=Nelumbo nucifera TaxID=4432 RepID=A0A822ZTM0_NELNU|nr:TPA_asm: hypothetical protein HUJ06_018230 [Nelumbo nucifera]